MNSRNGFTLIEVLAVIFVVTVGVAGIFTLVQDTVSSSRLVTYQLTSTYLAQEGIEIVRSIRDSNWLARRNDGTTAWNEGLDTDDTYRTDWTQLGEEDPLWSTDVDMPLQVDNDGYTYSGTSESPFSRTIQIENVDADGDGEVDKIEVTVRVTFNFQGEEETITTKEILYNWRR